MIRNLILVLGDQLDGASAAFDGFDAKADSILQIEAREEATYIAQHKKRLVFFFSAMRHFCAEQRAMGGEVFYSALDDPDNRGALAEETERRFKDLKAKQVIVLEPGDWRVRENLRKLPFVTFREDTHFLSSHADHTAFAAEHKHFVMETFYRSMRRQHGILLDKKGEPRGGRWNFDKDNRARLQPQSLSLFSRIPAFKPDKITQEVIADVERLFPDAPGCIDNFDMPVSRSDALIALDDFITYRLPDFGRYQDAMLGGEPFLFHSMLSGPLNLHLLSPREIIDAALKKEKEVPLNSLEGFVRQILGWREYVRMIYWRNMPHYAEENALHATLPVPKFYWTGETDMRCLSEAIRHTLDYAYAHHIERLMVLGLYCLLLGVHPYEVHRWHMAFFWDAIDWVSLPNTLGMSQYGDGGKMATKPYAASGQYINRMSDHCRSCRYDPAAATGEEACPFTVLYWDFLARHRTRFEANPRMKFAYANLHRKDAGELRAIRHKAEKLKAI